MFGDHDDDEPTGPTPQRRSSHRYGGISLTVILAALAGGYLLFKPTIVIGPVSAQHCQQYRVADREISALVYADQKLPAPDSYVAAKARVDACEDAGF